MRRLRRLKLSATKRDVNVSGPQEPTPAPPTPESSVAPLVVAGTASPAPVSAPASSQPGMTAGTFARASSSPRSVYGPAEHPASPPGKLSECMQLGKLFDRCSKKISGGKLPCYAGPAPGPFTIGNSATMLSRKFESVLRFSELGGVELEQDQFLGGRWLTVPDPYTTYRCELLRGLLHESLQVAQLMASTGQVVVYLISGDPWTKDRDQITCRDWLRLVVREHANSAGSLVYARSALKDVRLGPNESAAAAATRVVDAVIASNIDPEHPAAHEFFWTLATEEQMMQLIDRTLEAFGGGSLATILAAQPLRLTKCDEVRRLMRRHRVYKHDPKHPDMKARGDALHLFYNDLVAMVSVRTATDAVPSSTTPPPRRMPKYAGPDSMFAPLQPADSRRFTFGDLHTLTLPPQPLRTPMPSAALPAPANTVAALAPVPASDYDVAGEAEYMASGLEDRQDSELAAIRSQVASPPGQHGVPFVSSSRTPAPAPPASPSAAQVPPRRRSSVTPPPPTATRREIGFFLRRGRHCFHHAIRGTCSRNPCEWSHDLPDAFYRDAYPSDRFVDTAKAKTGGPQGYVVAALSPEGFESAVEQGYVLQQEPQAVSQTCESDVSA